MSEKKLKNRVFTAEFKTRIVLELIRGDVSVSDASLRYSIKDTQLQRWKKEFMERAPMVFGGSPPGDDQERRLNQLEQMFKEQSLELAILKKAQKLSQKKGGESS
jgi:transposase